LDLPPKFAVATSSTAVEDDSAAGFAASAFAVFPSLAFAASPVSLAVVVPIASSSPPPSLTAALASFSFPSSASTIRKSSSLDEAAAAVAAARVRSGDLNFSTHAGSLSLPDPSSSAIVGSVTVRFFVGVVVVVYRASRRRFVTSRQSVRRV
jgi:hypothetical protein